MAKNKTFDLTRDVRFKNTGTAPDAAGQDPQSGFAVLNAADIQASPFNEGLSQENIDNYVKSLEETGLIEPIAVYDLGNGKYEILSGHQRYEAWCKILGNSTIRAVILPYEEDVIKRFKAHTEANVLTRNKTPKFWNSRIRHAKKLLQDTGFNGPKSEEMKRVSEMLGGISPTQLYRYEAFERLVPELQAFEPEGVMSVNTLYQAGKLDEDQQRDAAARARDLQEKKKALSDDSSYAGEVTREEFGRIVADIKNGKKEEHNPRKKSTYSDRIYRAHDRLIGIMTRTKNRGEREEALKCIRQMKLELEEMERELM